MVYSVVELEDGINARFLMGRSITIPKRKSDDCKPVSKGA